MFVLGQEVLIKQGTMCDATVKGQQAAAPTMRNIGKKICIVVNKDISQALASSLRAHLQHVPALTAFPHTRETKSQ